jgi:alpha-N-arabinofuranosidase
MTTIKIDREWVIGEIDQRMYSGFVENMIRCVYGGIFDEGSPLSNAQGFRLDVLEALRPLKLAVVRGPGGNFVSGYHWVDGVGPRDARPRRMELAWHAEESNRFGTDEFLQFCELLGVEPSICVNMGTGTLDEARAWVEYCNGTGDTYWANLRRQNGREEPYNVKYWCLGNEMYGEWQIGALSAEDYSKQTREFAKVMKWTDPSIKLISCGMYGVDDWDRIVLETLAPYIDYHSLHLYIGSPDYYSNVFAPHHAERALRICQATIERVRYQQNIQHPIDIVYDEWNIWYREKPQPGVTEDRYTLADTLGVATFLNIFLRACQTVKMAHFALLVNVSAPIITSAEGLLLQPTYSVAQLYTAYMRGDSLNVHVDCPTYDLKPEAEISSWPHRVADLGPFKLLDVAAVYNHEQDVFTLAVVNRDQHAAHTSTIQCTETLAPHIEVFELNAADINATNSFAEPHTVKLQEKALTISPNQQAFTCTFPAHSLTFLRMKRAV